MSCIICHSISYCCMPAEDSLYMYTKLHGHLFDIGYVPSVANLLLHHLSLIIAFMLQIVCVSRQTDMVLLFDIGCVSSTPTEVSALFPFIVRFVFSHYKNCILVTLDQILLLCFVCQF